MKDTELPALYQAADTLSVESQKHFFVGLKAHLALLVIGALLSIGNIPHTTIAIAQACVFLAALSCSVYLYARRPDRVWYAARAVAESVKTIAWRYATRAEPFHNGDDTAVRAAFRAKLKDIIEQNREVAQALTTHLTGEAITKSMTDLRAKPLADRMASYKIDRISHQLEWYADKTTQNQQLARRFFGSLVLFNAAAVLLALLRIAAPEFEYWPIDVIVAVAASLLAWMQAKRFTELAASYALTAHEIGLIRDQIDAVATDTEFSSFVGDSENAFSREHTQWVARRDA